MNYFTTLRNNSLELAAKAVLEGKTIEELDEATKFQKQLYASWKKMTASQLESEKEKLVKHRDQLSSANDKEMLSADIAKVSALIAKSKKNESVEDLDEAANSTAVKKLITAVEDLESDELESFLLGLSKHYHEQHEEFDNADFLKLSDALKKAYVVWANRSGN